MGDAYENVPKPRPTQTMYTAPQILYSKHGTSKLIFNRDASKKIISFPAVKITGTLPSLASLTPCCNSDSIVIPTKSSVELGSPTSVIDEPLVSDTLPSPLSSMIGEKISEDTDDSVENDYVPDIMDFPTDEEDMELGNFLLDAADWL